MPLGVAIVTSVNLQAAIGQHGYQRIGTTEKIDVISMMRTSVEM